MTFSLDRSLTLATKQTGLRAASEVLGWFSYAVDLADPVELNGEAKKLIARVLKDECGRFDDWCGELHYLPMPFLKYINRGFPFIEVTVDLYLAASVKAQLSYSAWRHVEFAKLLRKEVDKFRVPVIFLEAIANGDLKMLNQFKVVERNNHCITLDIPGFGEMKLPDRLIASFRHFLRGKRVGQALVEAGLVPLDAGNLIDATIGKTLTAGLVKANMNLPLPAAAIPPATGGGAANDNSDVIAALEAMGYKKGEIKGMIEAAHLSPGISLEEKVKAVLKTMAL